MSSTEQKTATITGATISGVSDTCEDMVAPLLPAVLNVEDMRGHERPHRGGPPAAKGDVPQRLVEGQSAHGGKQVLAELDLAYAGRSHTEARK